MGEKKTSDLGLEENMDSNRDLVEEDYQMKVGEGKKQPRNSLFSQVSAELDLRKTSDGYNHVHICEISVGSARQGSRMQ